MIKVEIDTRDLERFAAAMQAAGKKTPPAVARAVRRAGASARTGMVRALVKQTGLKYAVINRALRAASENTMGFVIRSKGGDVRLKFFKPRETRAGVSAAPRNVRQVYASTFMKGGRFPNRVAIARKLTGGGVYVRTGGSKWPVKQARSGVIIPEDMVRGMSEAAFNSIVARELPKRLEHELGRLIGLKG